MASNSPPMARFARVSLLVFVILMTVVVAFDPFSIRSAPPESGGKALKVELSRGPFTVLVYPSQKRPPSALLVFGSGDGGWSDLEGAIAQAFQKQGWMVIGIDCKAYAQTDYDLETLQADYGKITRTALSTLGNHPPPVVIGGYSMGAAQAIATAGGPNPPPGVVGLLVLDPLSRGRYGLRSSDQINVLPEGSGTFSVDAFADKMGPLRVVQWHAENDSIDSQSWLNSLTAPHKLHVFPKAGHSYVINRNDFLRQLVKSSQWILRSSSNTALTAQSGAHP